MSGERGVVPLRRLPFDTRPAQLACDDGVVELVLPKWLGDTPWRIPAEEVGVADLDAVGWGTADDVFRDRLALPYLTTMTRVADPTVVLLFRNPQRLPPGASSSLRSRDGVVDGVTLRAHDPALAVEVLSTGGAIAVGDPSRFLRQHREVVDDPAERAALLRGDRAGTRLRQGSTVLFYLALFLVTWLVASGDQPPVWWVAPAVALVLAAALRWRAVHAAAGP